MNSQSDTATLPQQARSSLSAKEVILYSLLFAISYCQAPLYYSNQNQYFLHGLAEGGYGFLNQDWLANTADPTPVFSGMVAFTQRYLHPLCFYLYYGILFAIYLFSLLHLFSLWMGPKDTPRLRFGFFVLLLVLHSGLIRWASYRLLGLDYPWYWQAGVAGQYVLGGMFQPSCFGVFLLWAIALACRGRFFGAVFSACLAANIHFTYLLSAAFFTLAIQLYLLRMGQSRRALWVGLWAILLVTPVSLYVLSTFQPTTAEAFAEAQRLVVHVRIPHHSLPQLWCDPIAMLQIGWMLLAWIVIRTQLLGWIYGILFFASALLTLVQVGTASDTLALMFPWRTSVILMPLATMILLAWLVRTCARLWQHPKMVVLQTVLLIICIIGGLALMYYRQGFQNNPDEVPLMAFVQQSKQKDDLYWIPVQLPNLKSTTRGSLSSDFKPVAAKKQDGRLIPVDFQGFRLGTGAPIFVDFKSIPYRDVDVLEWYQRMQVTQQITASMRAGQWSEVQIELKKWGITHLVIPMDLSLEQCAFPKLYEQANYRVLRVP